MGKYVLAAGSGALGGIFFVTVPTPQVGVWVLLGLVVTLLIGFLVSWRQAGFWFLMFTALFLGHLTVRAEDAFWQTLPETLSVDTSFTVIKREVPKTWYQPIILRPMDEGQLSVDVLWRAPRTATLTPGEQIQLRCELKRPENFDPHFDYVRYLATRGIGYVCERSLEVIPLETRDQFRFQLFQIRAKIQTEINTLLSEPAAGLLQGLFLGGDDTLPQSLTEQFRRAGLSHLVAVSGYNMTLVAFAVLFITLSLGLWRRTAMVLAAVGILIFLLLIDTSAASIRAALMAWIVFLAFFVGRLESALHGLLLAAFLMAIENPLIVRYDVGFQLSCVATLTLLLIGPWLEILVKQGGWWRKALALLLATIAIEISIAPIVIIHFGMVSLLGPLANLIVLPLIPIVMALGGVVLFLSFLWPLLAQVVILPLWWLLMVIIWTAEFIEGLSWSAWSGVSLTPVVVISWYLVLLGLSWYSRISLKRYALRMDH